MRGGTECPAPGPVSHIVENYGVTIIILLKTIDFICKSQLLMRRNQSLAMLPRYRGLIHVEQYGFSIDQGKVKTAKLETLCFSDLPQRFRNGFEPAH